MKNNIQALSASMIAIALLWIIPITSVQAQLSVQQCIEKNDVIGQRLHFAEKKYGRSPISDARGGYAYELDVQEYYRGECSHLRDAAYHLERSIISMENYGRACKKLGLGSNCNITSADEFYSGFTSQEIASSNQAQSTTENDSNQAQPNNDSPPTKKLTAAERKKQQAQQKADDLGTQSQQLAQENQSKADAARQGKRKVHDPAAEAHNCIKVNTGGSTGSMVNTCNFKISYVDCRYNNTSDELKNWLTCEKQKFGFGFIDAHNEDLTFTRKVQKIYWFACKEPSRPVDYNFVEGRGISGRCHDTANSD